MTYVHGIIIALAIVAGLSAATQESKSVFDRLYAPVVEALENH